MKQFKIVELKDGHGNSNFRIKVKRGWGWFCFWETWATHETMQKAVDKVKNFIDEEKSRQETNVKEFMYTPIPNHLPEEQIGKFLEVCKKKN